MSPSPSAADDPFEWSPRASEPPSVQKLYKVAELTRVIRTQLENVGRVAVEGEVSKVMRAASGHVYFDLKDLDAKIACTIWKSQVPSALRFQLAEGQQVIAHGKLDVYGARGTYSLNVARVEQAGIGALLLKLEELKARLKAQGWFERRRPLPSLPRVIGVVTSRDGAAFQDFLRTRSLRWPLYPVRLAHTSVQGASAANEIAAAIRRLDACGVDVIVVCRGGGSLEDLWAFNEMVVIEAIRGASVPVVAGIGHETDVTLSDLVADHRAHTPTDAAQCVIPDRAAIFERLQRAEDHLLRTIDFVLEDRARRIEHAAASTCLRSATWMLDVRRDRVAAASRALSSMLSARLAQRGAQVESMAARIARQSPAAVVERRVARVESLGVGLGRALERPMQRLEQRLSVLERTLAATSPFNVLARGYSITHRRGSSAPLTRADDVRPGDVLETRLAAGSVVSAVERSEEAR